MTTRCTSVCHSSSFRNKKLTPLLEEINLGRKAFSRSNSWSLAALNGEQGLAGEAGWPLIEPSITATTPTPKGSR